MLYKYFLDFVSLLSEYPSYVKDNKRKGKSQNILLQAFQVSGEIWNNISDRLQMLPHACLINSQTFLRLTSPAMNATSTSYITGIIQALTTCNHSTSRRVDNACYTIGTTNDHGASRCFLQCRHFNLFLATSTDNAITLLMSPKNARTVTKMALTYSANFPTTILPFYIRRYTPPPWCRVFFLRS
jgi:hypothetical protein